MVLDREKPNREYVGQRLVPDVVRQTANAAQANVEKDGLVCVVKKFEMPADWWMEGAWKGLVYEQTPKAGTRVLAESTVTIRVAPDETATVPNVIGMTVAAATARLARANAAIHVKNPAFATDHISFQYPHAGELVMAGSRVTVSKGNADRVAVPFIVGKNKAAAEKMLDDVGLVGVFSVVKPADYDAHPPFDWAGKGWQCLPAEGRPCGQGQRGPRHPRPQRRRGRALYQGAL